MIKRLLLILSSLIAYVNLYAQPAQLILSQKEGRITFAVDEVDIPDNHCGLKTTGSKLSLDLNRNIDGDLFSDWEPKILANSFADVDISKTKTRERELDALVKASEELKCDNLLLITWDQNEEVNYKGKMISVLSVENGLTHNKNTFFGNSVQD